MTLVEDVYTTRVSDEPQVIGRPDPVFWGDPITAEYADFDRRGYLQRENVIGDADVGACLAEIDPDPSTIRRCLRDDERIVREDGSDAVRSIFDILELSDAVRRVVELSGAYDIARDVLGRTSTSTRAGSTTSRDSRAARSTGTRISRPGTRRTACPVRAR